MKRALVVGASGGIGRAISTRRAAEGCVTEMIVRPQRSPYR